MITWFHGWIWVFRSHKWIAKPWLTTRENLLLGLSGASLTLLRRHSPSFFFSATFNNYHVLDWDPIILKKKKPLGLDFTVWAGPPWTHDPLFSTQVPKLPSLALKFLMSQSRISLYSVSAWGPFPASLTSAPWGQHGSARELTQTWVNAVPGCGGSACLYH